MNPALILAGVLMLVSAAGAVVIPIPDSVAYQNLPQTCQKTLYEDTRNIFWSIGTQEAKLYFEANKTRCD